MRIIGTRLIALLVAAIATAMAQTTQGLILGRLLDTQAGRPVELATISCRNTATDSTTTARSDKEGFFVLPLLSPGPYQIRVEAEQYQAQEVDDLELPVAGRLELNLRLRPLNDVWEAGQYRSVFLPGSKALVTFYGPDVDGSRLASVRDTQASRGVLESSISQVVDPAQIAALPLAGRDVYTMLVTQPGINADTTTARSLGLSVNGQRTSASSFLLDGMENNNYLVTGPLTSITPEAIQEYRISTNNFSAEYGRTSGYLINAVTRSGVNQWHGIAYFNLKNEILNANDFQSNLRGLARPAAKEDQPGFWTGGPLGRKSLFLSVAFDALRSRGRGPNTSFLLPTPNLLAATSPNSLARKLLTEFPSPAGAAPGLTSVLTLRPPVSVDQSLGIIRLDKTFADGSHRLMGRFAVARISRPDFDAGMTPYKDFISGLEQTNSSIGVGLVSTLRPDLTNEVRVGFSWENLDLNRPHPEIPLLTPSDGTTLPGSPVFSAFSNVSRNWELLDNVILVRDRHIIKSGGGALLRTEGGILTAGSDGQYGFANAAAFAADRPNVFRLPLDRSVLPDLRIPDFQRDYRLGDIFFFVQDTYRATRRLTFNYGIRYESFGAPVNTGRVKDGVIELGAGDTIARKVAGARLTFPQGGNQQLYPTDGNNWGPRFGFAYSVTPGGATILRGGYGVFYDRTFDNAWMNARNNIFVLPTAFPVTGPINYLAPPATVLPAFQGSPVNLDFSTLPYKTQSARAPLTLFQPDLRTPYTQSWFLGITQQMGRNTSVEVNGQGSLGRKLLTTDIINRAFNLNPNLGAISYRANQGLSNYNALTAAVRYYNRLVQFQAAYTWSHAIDNQSEILRNDYFNLEATRVTDVSTRPDVSAFSRQFDSRIDRANADFDQRQNFTFYSIWTAPAWRGPAHLGWLFRGWRMSQLAAIRAGVPFTVFALDPPQSPIVNNRPNLLNPAALVPANTAVAGGERLLSASAFGRAATGQVGNLGRNSFRGPGFYNLDLSVSRSFTLRWLGEAGRLTLRADAFNFLNHANLNLPDVTLGSPTFGIARYGRNAPASGLPILSPVNDTSRQIQLILRIGF